ncbi:MAG: hypothetical protein COA67_00580 [Lutibacter sp.]|nr:MAG: hypothetical protein COA67_00580 [Lutibacter sp.]
MKNSKSYYNSLANTYSVQVNDRIKYLNAIDDFIINDNLNVVDNYLDIGCGDGRRSVKISESINVKYETILVDDSLKMLSKFEGKPNIKTFNQSIFDFNHSDKFNLITCLWNVLGHFPSKEAIISLFQKINDLLVNGGAFIFDVNNRYNISHYGYENVERNLKNDKLNMENNGWFKLGNEPNQTKVYVHSPFDIEEYLLDTDLILEQVKYIDYKTGEPKETFFEGQLLYKITKK